MSDPNTDEALVTNFRHAIERMERWPDDQTARRDAVNLERAILERLSQPPSGGWDDAAVERFVKAFATDWAERAGITYPTERKDAFYAGITASAVAALNSAAPREPSLDDIARCIERQPWLVDQHGSTECVPHNAAMTMAADVLALFRPDRVVDAAPRGTKSVREIAFQAIQEMRQKGESAEMCARWISERYAAAPRESLSVEPSPDASDDPGLSLQAAYVVMKNGKPDRVFTIPSDAEFHAFCIGGRNWREQTDWRDKGAVSLHMTILDTGQSRPLESKSGAGSTPQTLSPAPREQKLTLAEMEAKLDLTQKPRPEDFPQPDMRAVLKAQSILSDELAAETAPKDTVSMDSAAPRGEEGWVLVPIEPTDAFAFEVGKAARRAFNIVGGRHAGVTQVGREILATISALAAAPKAPLPPPPKASRT